MGFSTLEGALHEPVLQEEVLRLLDPRPGGVVVDATLGSGGHAVEILKRIGKGGRLIGIDQDPEALRRCRERLKAFSRVEFFQENFSNLDLILHHLNLEAVDAVLMDVGFSAEQLETADRGFSFLKEGPLDMRMDPGPPLRARDLVNDLSQEDLENIFRRYGEERWSRRIAGVIARERTARPIETTTELVRLVEKAVPRQFQHGRLHPATRVFQALRIAVNGELEALEGGLPKAFRALGPGGRLAVISFHSLEDRIVKRMFRGWAGEGRGRLLTPKPIQAAREEVGRNPRSRSAKLRGIEKYRGEAGKKA